jgi:ATP-dependent Clp protease adapter protein ClpS
LFTALEKEKEKIREAPPGRDLPDWMREAIKHPEGEVEPVRPWRVMLENAPDVSGHAVIHCLEDVFRKSRAEATRLTLLAHERGRSSVFDGTREIAEMREKAGNDCLVAEGYRGCFVAEAGE